MLSNILATVQALYLFPFWKAQKKKKKKRSPCLDTLFRVSHVLMAIILVVRLWQEGQNAL